MEPEMGAYSPPLTFPPQYTDSISPIFADRPIRPLPKRRLRSNPSVEADGPIGNQSVFGKSNRLFQIPFFESARSDYRPTSPIPGQYDASQQAHSEITVSVSSGSVQGPHPKLVIPWGNHNQITSTIGESIVSAPLPREQSLSNTINHPWNTKNTHLGASGVPNNIPAIPADGYDSFENTNNKKKRKIPNNAAYHAASATEISSSGVLPGREVETADLLSMTAGSYSNGAISSTSSTKAMPKPRQVRPSTRRRSTRSPLGVSNHGLNRPESTFPDIDVGLKARPEFRAWKEMDHQVVRPARSSVRKHNASQVNDPRGSRKTQFTFTCESEASKSVAWSASDYPGYVHANAIARDHHTSSSTILDQAHRAEGQISEPHTTPASTTNRIGRRRIPLVRQYTIAARDRRLRQNYSNFHHPPRDEDIWICDFCEYEAIFGRPPEALLRQYEIKDRRERRRLAEKRRLLEKAKMKHKRGKKSGKVSKDTTPNVPEPSSQCFPGDMEDEPPDLRGIEPTHNQQIDELLNDEISSIRQGHQSKGGGVGRSSEATLHQDYAP